VYLPGYYLGRPETANPWTSKQDDAADEGEDERLHEIDIVRRGDRPFADVGGRLQESSTGFDGRIHRLFRTHSFIGVTSAETQQWSEYRTPAGTSQNRRRDDPQASARRDRGYRAHLPWIGAPKPQTDRTIRRACRQANEAHVSSGPESGLAADEAVLGGTTESESEGEVADWSRDVLRHHLHTGLPMLQFSEPHTLVWFTTVIHSRTDVINDAAASAALRLL